jgi:hypothetical protein
MIKFRVTVMSYGRGIGMLRATLKEVSDSLFCGVALFWPVVAFPLASQYSGNPPITALHWGVTAECCWLGLMGVLLLMQRRSQTAE